MKDRLVCTICIVSVYFVFCSVIALGQDIAKSPKPKNRVDSLFVTNFKNMENLLNNNIPIGDDRVDRFFILMTAGISGINCYGQDYSGFCHFTIKELNLWKLWYEKNKNKLDSFAVFRGLDLMKKKSINQNEMQELDSLLLINTFKH